MKMKNLILLFLLTIGAWNNLAAQDTVKKPLNLPDCNRSAVPFRDENKERFHPNAQSIYAILMNTAGASVNISDSIALISVEKALSGKDTMITGYVSGISMNKQGPCISFAERTTTVRAVKWFRWDNNWMLYIRTGCANPVLVAEPYSFTDSTEPCDTLNWVEVICQIDTLHDTITCVPINIDTAMRIPKVYASIAFRKSRATGEFGGGYRITQLYAKKDSTVENAPWIQRAIQITVGAEAGLALSKHINSIDPDCTNCGGLGQKTKKGVDVGLTSRLFITLDFRGKKTLLLSKKSPRYEVRGYTGLVYHMTEVFEGQTRNRKEDGLELIVGASIIALNPKSASSSFTGPEVDIFFGLRPLAEWESHMGILIKGLFGGNRTTYQD